MYEAILEKLMQRRRITAAGCWEYTGLFLNSGYGQIFFQGKTWRVHRLMYVIENGAIPATVKVLHSCDNPPCFNPDHLEAGTDKKNAQQSVERSRHFEAKKTHCDRGHELVGDNLYVDIEGRRHCKFCNMAKQRLRAGWPEDLAYSVPKGQGLVPEGMMRIAPKPTRKRLSSHCSNGHLLEGDNVYITKRGYKECQECHRVARARFEEKRRLEIATAFDAQ